jgi:cation diffusion facilitator CzcD-associated flavoprotein CzcO
LPNPDWSRKWAKRAEIFAYLTRAAKEVLQLQAHTTFQCRLINARYRDGLWTLTVEDVVSGKITTHAHNFLMSRYLCLYL